MLFVTGYQIKTPTAPVREPPARDVRPSKSILKKTPKAGVSNAAPKAESLFASSKKDKRRIKHAELMNKITKSAAKKPRRRRPNKKLATALDTLAAALPDDNELENNGARVTGNQPQDQINIIKRKSMKSRPGAMKRREKLDNGERNRFAKNMAQLVTPRSLNEAVLQTPKDTANGPGKTVSIPSTSERWAALRGFIFQTLETKPGLKKVTS
ncbi:uncharacterized protein Z519_02071 [Cladophialophora bantiana CBS 173.52]|uniref:Ribosome biogenesis protein SLX9 n=1 Tax=Cladophialophora bantiana (strain ATCC 10958 / CBS 173.52 / CDC B-1940 / NIH 8579) TaxID=1442370 RepID=A0A0D2I0I2_CLAB1|nr:uncharacterized protein Z519_02071 [Cladophialophora bantiana CBS 173.52]KIW96680.1 hypothetical protein Z519_02071 [Cladophialophora bantiana CBS 173.52]